MGENNTIGVHITANTPPRKDWKFFKTYFALKLTDNLKPKIKRETTFPVLQVNYHQHKFAIIVQPKSWQHVRSVHRFYSVKNQCSNLWASFADHLARNWQMVQ